MSDPDNTKVTKQTFATKEMPTQSSRARMVTLTGPDSGRIYRFKSEACIGRDYDCEVRLDAPDASRRHAQLTQTAAGDWVIEDLGSRNGTWANGMPVDGVKQVEFGDRIQIGGNTIFIFTHYDHLEEQVLQLQKMQSIGQLAGEVAHDFKNLLSVVISNVDYLRRATADGTLKPDEFQECLTEMDEVSRQAVDLTSRLLGFSRQTKGNESPVDLSALASEVLKLCERTFDSSIVLNDRVGVDLWTLGDRGQLHSALMNLCINARDAMPEGGELEVRIQKQLVDGSGLLTVPLPSAGNYVILSVKDSGQGMDEATCERAFEPFFTTKGDQGTGLGLATVFGVVKNHGGHVEVDSEVGEGTTFRIFLPSHDETIEHAATFHDNPTPVAEPDIEANTVMVVDDEDPVRLALSRMLQSMGYTVLTARDGMEAVGFYERHQRQIVMVVLDMVMPELDGEETFVILRKMNPNVKVLITSGWSLDDKLEQLKALGINGYLPKPYSEQELYDAINDAMGGPAATLD